MDLNSRKKIEEDEGESAVFGCRLTGGCLVQYEISRSGLVSSGVCAMSIHSRKTFVVSAIFLINLIVGDVLR